MDQIAQCFFFIKQIENIISMEMIWSTTQWMERSALINLWHCLQIEYKINLCSQPESNLWPSVIALYILLQITILGKSLLLSKQDICPSCFLYFYTSLPYLFTYGHVWFLTWCLIDKSQAMSVYFFFIVCKFMGTNRVQNCKHW